MALQLDTNDTQYGANFADSYARVVTFSGDNVRFKILVEHFVDKAARDSGAKPIWSQVFTIPFAELPSAANPIAAAYAWLKQQELYAPAIDV